ncbi:lysosomal alpha-mannosidase-like isoform X2 [Ornithodoros turicata]|uniref:lysosomal alpha-mannosidase-like isoform X2 n=1 Tax=Ornithodoros turicata TaxID=34597 RepID=UPI00313A36B0
MVVRFLLSVCNVIFVVGAVSVNKCEDMGCPTTKGDHINVHITPHSHNDAGWIQTLKQIYEHSVSYIYTNSIDALLQNRQRRYVSAENVFFSRWWTEQSPEQRQAVRKLVTSGRLQFVGGGWVQNDEACTHYTAIIDQMTLGLRFLNETFGECGRPTVAWQADPFGHSRNQANLFALMGFDGLMLGRISMEEVEKRHLAKEMLFVWRTEPGDRRDTDIFTWIPPGSYSTPSRLCFDGTSCGKSEEQSQPGANEVAGSMVSYTYALADTYPPSQVALLYGGDLAFRSASEVFDHLDAAIDAANGKGRPRLLQHHYSTPACYVKALYGLNRTWTVFGGDFFPYTDHPARTWTGFYTSRPALKYMTRYANGFLQACKQLAVTAGGEQTSRLEALKEAVAVLQHHDGITGTATEEVVWDYIDMLWAGILRCESAIRDSISYLMNSNKHSFSVLPFKFCHLLNISQCSFTEKEKQFTVVVYNPMSRQENVAVRLPVTVKSATVTDSKGSEVEVQRYRLEVDTTTGLVTRLHLLGRRLTIAFRQTFGVYEDDDGVAPEPAGHYVFSAVKPPVERSSRVTYKVIKGPVVQEIHQIYNEAISQVIRLYKGMDTIEFQWTVGPINPLLGEYATGRDIVTTYATDLRNNGVFYTDSNGRQSMKRTLKEGSDFALPIPSNYYPVVSWIYIQDQYKGLQLSVIPDRAQGGTSFKDGMIELMLHRRHPTSDNLGNSELLEETGVDGKGLIARGKHYVHLGTLEESFPVVRQASLRRVYLPVTMVTAFPLPQRIQYAKKSTLEANLPDTLHLLTLEPISKNRVLFRVEHLGLVNRSVQISLRKLLKDRQFEDIQPTLLGANEYLQNVQRLHWSTKTYDRSNNKASGVKNHNLSGETDKVTLRPGDIQTFVAKLKYMH